MMLADHEAKSAVHAGLLLRASENVIVGSQLFAPRMSPIRGEVAGGQCRPIGNDRGTPLQMLP
jgi:hypothetical protein